MDPRALYENKDLADVTLRVSDGVSLRLHKIVLHSASPFFARALAGSTDMVEARTGEIDMRDCGFASVLEKLVPYMYGCRDVIFDLEDAGALQRASDYLMLKPEIGASLMALLKWCSDNIGYNGTNYYNVLSTLRWDSDGGSDSGSHRAHRGNIKQTVSFCGSAKKQEGYLDVGALRFRPMDYGNRISVAAAWFELAKVNHLDKLGDALAQLLRDEPGQVQLSSMDPPLVLDVLDRPLKNGDPFIHENVIRMLADNESVTPKHVRHMLPLGPALLEKLGIWVAEHGTDDAVSALAEHAVTFMPEYGSAVHKLPPKIAVVALWEAVRQVRAFRYEPPSGTCSMCGKLYFKDDRFQANCSRPTKKHWFKRGRHAADSQARCVKCGIVAFDGGWGGKPVRDARHDPKLKECASLSCCEQRCRDDYEQWVSY